MARRTKLPPDTVATLPTGRLTNAMHAFLASLEGASGMDLLTPIADMAGTETLAQTQTKINDLLAALRVAGILRAS